jgi:RNA ligase
MGRVKHPKTPHLPWSPGIGSDDDTLTSLDSFEGAEVVATIKYDGENTTMYRDAIHARSLDSGPHPSRDWVRALHGRVRQDIPEGWRVCGENLYARHSLAYDDLPSYFLVFSIWDERNVCLSWQDTLSWAALLDLSPVQTFYTGLWNPAVIHAAFAPLATRHEGSVIRLAGAFARDDFAHSCAKWVRENHVQTDEHWMHQAVVPNRLRSSQCNRSRD